jgi:D-serine deaminase-like pyridoxal phosphate-dependent protein
MTAVDNLATPAAVVDGRILDANVARLADAAAARGVAVRPHLKTHKCLAIASRQLARGAVGFTVATMDEAELLVDGAIEDVFVCYPPVGEARVRRLLALARRARISTIVETEDGARELAAAAVRAGIELEIRIKVDTGVGRVGVALGEPLERLAATVRKLDGLHLTGIATHEGWAYRTPDPERRATAVREGLGAFVTAGRELGCQIISTGATPATWASLEVPGVTEVRAGNYVVHDAMQIGLGNARLEDCALRVVTTVVSVRPGRAIVDAGSKALSADVSAHGMRLVDGHGIVVGRPGTRIPALSEEHGWLTPGENEPPLRVGERIEIIPAHACPTIACFAQLHLAEDGEVLETMAVGARGYESQTMPA